MTEEQVTKALLQYLTDSGWHIVCFDFPQSGTGRVLHPNNADSEKNKDSIIPDIVAVKNNISLFFENKDRFYFPDYKKVNELIVDNQYTNAIDKLLSDYEIDNIFYGIGLPTDKHKEKSEESAHLVNFILGVNTDKSIEILYNPEKIDL
ncbi:MAG: hypothetical protein MR019_00480 [Ruminococcus sp.]|nr:hypothetical protein [Ruminococcus sp.]MDY3895336.1 hypothetical protein [Candidatus Fimenecus sp.]